MKAIARKISAVILLGVILGVGCSKDKDSPAKNGTHKIMFKAETSAGASLGMAVYGYDATLTTITSLGGTTWTSPEITATNASLANVTVNGIGANASSTLKVQIYVDGVLKKEGTSSGTVLSTNAQFSLR